MGIVVIYSASAVDRVTNFCLRGLHETVPQFMRNAKFLASILKVVALMSDGVYSGLRSSTKWIRG